jgi:hypothetical protein
MRDNFASVNPDVLTGTGSWHPRNLPANLEMSNVVSGLDCKREFNRRV